MPRIKYGGYLLAIAALQLIIAMIVVQLYFPCNSHGCYNILTNPISDLGNTVLSPLWPVFNYSLVLLAVLGTLGLLSVYNAFYKSTLCRAGVVILAICLVTGAGVGVVSENTILTIHSLFALVSFVAGAIGVFVFGLGVYKMKGYKGYSIYSIASGLLSSLAIVILRLPSVHVLPAWAYYGPGIGFGGPERLIIAPLLVWIIVTGIMIERKGGRASKV